ncbi:MAG: lipid core-O-antigen ligase-like enyme [Proteobacteria bacterium]|nr:lipid core-O-antigen ligase-like enyme [Pseudomonadota bacterium]
MLSNSSAKWHLRLCLISLTLMFFVPLLLAHHRNPIPTFYQEWLAAAFSLLALTFLFCPEVRPRIDLPEIALLPISLLGILVLQLFFNRAVNTDRLLLFALYLIWATFLIILGRQLVQSATLGRLSRWLAIALLCSGLLQCLAAALQIGGTPGLPWVAPFNGRPAGNLAQGNSFAVCLWLGIASIIYLRASGWLAWRATLPALITLIFFSLLSGSRAVWLYCPAMLLLAGIAYRRNRLDPLLRRLFRCALVTLLATLLIQLVLSSGLIPLGDFLANTGAARLAQTGGYDPIRLALWQSALRIFAEHPFIGGGIGQFTWQFHQHVLQLMPMHLPGLPEHAHNIFMHLLAEMGLGAVLVLLIFACRWLIVFWRKIWQPCHWWLAACLLLLAIHSNLEYPLWYSFFLGPFALLLGAGSGRSLQLSIQRIATPLLAGALILGGLTLVTLFRDYAVLEETINQGFSAKDRVDFHKKYAERLQKIGKTSLLSPYVYMVAGNLQEDNAEELENKLTLCHHALRFAATRDIVYKCAHIEALAGNHAVALLALRRALAAYPDHAEIVRKNWQKRAVDEPLLADLLKEFPPTPAPKQ